MVTGLPSYCDFHGKALDRLSIMAVRWNAPRLLVVLIVSLASATAQGQREVVFSLSDSSNSLDVTPATQQTESSSLGDGDNLRDDLGDEHTEAGGRRGGRRGRRGRGRKRGLFTSGSFRVRSANRAGNDGT